MSFQGLKKTHEDDKKAVFTHKDGHTITIAKSGLSSQRLKELKNLPLHQSDPDAPVGDDSNPSWMTPDMAAELNNGAQRMVDSAPDRSDEISRAKNRIRTAVDSGSKNTKADLAAFRQQMAPSSQDSSSDEPTPTNQPPQYSPPNPYQEDVQGNSSPAPQDNQPSSADLTQSGQTGLGATAPGSSSGVGAFTPGSAGANNKNLLQETAYNRNQIFKNTGIDVGVPYITSPQEYQALALDEKNKKLQNWNAWQNDLQNGHVTPKTYGDLFHDASLPGKALMIFGMLASGAGSGLAHQQNAALTMMDNQIQNDLNAQKASKTNAHNFIQLQYQHQYQQALERGMDADTAMKQAGLQVYGGGDAMPFLSSARNHAIQIGIDKMPDFVNGMPNQDKAKYQQAFGVLQRHTAGMADNIYSQQVANQLNDPDAVSRMKVDRAKLGGALMQNNLIVQSAGFEENHHLPGYFQRSDREVTGEDRNDLKHLNTLEQSYLDAKDYMKRAGALGPLHMSDYMKTPLYAEGQRLKSRMETEVGKLSENNKYVSSMKNLNTQRIPDLLGTHFTPTDNQSVDDLIQEIRERRASIYHNYGLGPSRAYKLTPEERAKLRAGLKHAPSPEVYDQMKRMLGD